MKNVIKINGTNLSLNNISSSNNIIDLSSVKKKMKYQFVVSYNGEINGKSYKIHETSTYGQAKIINLGFEDGTWAIITNSKSYFSGENYTKDDLRIIYGFILATYKNGKLDTCENLCLATEDQNIIQKFYSSYGSFKTCKLDDMILNTAWEDDYIPSKSATKNAKIYGGRRYSIYRLMNDLVKDKSKVLVNKELVGPYHRITPKKEDSNKKYDTDKWWEILDVKGNRRRANLSLVLKSKVIVEIPKNDKRVTPGIRNLNSISSFCLVKDGIHHVKYLGVEINDIKLRRKIKGAGLVEMNLLNDGQYLLNLEKIPVISKSDIKPIKSSEMAKLVLDWLLEDARFNYYNRLIHKNEYEKNGTKKAVVLDEKEKYLRSLGIYGKNYVPVREKVKFSGNSYDTIDLTMSVKGFPKSIFRCINKVSGITNGYSPKTGSDEFNLVEWLKKQDTTSKPLSELLDDSENRYEDLNVELRNRVFCLIMSKNVRFNDYLKPDVDEVTGKVKTKDFGEIDVKWMFKRQTVEI